MGMETRLENLRSRINELKVSDKTKNTLNRFDKEISVSGSSLDTRYNYMKCLRNLLKYKGKSIESITKDDIVDFLDHMKATYTEGTINQHKHAIKKIYKYMNGGDEFPKLVKWIKIKKNGHKVLDSSELLSEEEIKNIMDVTVSERYKSLIAVLYESACRINELLCAKIKDLHFDEHGAVITVDGKTGKRRIRLVNSVPLIKQWINKHPFKNDHDSYVWLSMKYGNVGNKMSNSNVLSILKERAKLAGINKRIFCHQFRHSRLTELAKRGLTEFELKVFAGWEMDSSMAKVYVRMTDRDVGNKILQLSGKIPEVAKNKSPLEAIKCPNCEVENPATGKFCYGCVLPVDPESVKKFVMKERFEKIMQEASEDPRIGKVIEILEEIMSRSPL